MAGKKTNHFSVNSRRFDPYKGFKFRSAVVPLVLAAAAAGAAAYVLTRKLSAKRGGAEDSTRRADLDAGFLRRLRF